MKLILASASPRRREILTTLGVEFTVRVADADETCDLADPGARVEAISLKKCLAVQKLLEADARCMIRMLQGRTHTVASGLAIWYRGRTVTSHELTGVTFAPMKEGEIEAYLATGESFGKAGGYAVQGYAARYITGITGDYFNVVGLPVRRLYETLRLAFGITL